MVDGFEVSKEPALLEKPRRAAAPRLSLVCAEDGSLSAAMEASNPEEFAAMFGGAAREFADQAVHDLLNVALTAAPTPGTVNTTTVNALIQAVSGVRPVDETEAMLAIQLAAFHHVTLCCLRRSQQSTTAMESRALNLSQANKCARTFAGLLDALARHWGKCTTQRVIVENVTVEAGGQAVVGAVSGGGGCKKDEVQPHATRPQNQNRRRRRAALPSANPARNSLPASRGSR